MTAPLWTAEAKADAGATSISVTAPVPIDFVNTVVLALICGVVATPTEVTIPTGGSAVSTLATTVNSWWQIFRATGATGGNTVTLNVGASTKFMSALLCAYGGDSLTYRGGAAKVGTTASLVLPAIATRDDPASTIVDMWSARDAGTGVLTTVSQGTIRRTFRGAGSNNTVLGVSDQEASNLANTGVFSTSSGNGGGGRVEVFYAGGAPVDPSSDPIYVMRNGVLVKGVAHVMRGGVLVEGKPYIMRGGVLVPATTHA